MVLEFRLPDLGEGIAEGEIVKWLVKPGDTVEEHQELVEMETDKAVVQVPSPRAGTVLSINGNVGDKIKVGEILCIIGEAEEKASSNVQAKQEPPKMKRTPAGAVGELEEAPDEEEKVSSVPTPPKKKTDAIIQALPAVRKLAQEMNVNLSQIKGSGEGGRITEDDVRKSSGKEEKSEAKAPSVSFDAFGRVLRIPLKGVRKTIAQNMTKSLQTAAHVTHMDMVDVTRLWDVREKEKVIAEEKGVKLTFLPFVVKACVLALKEFPYVNSSLDDEKEEIVLKQFYNIGVAVDTPNGLMVPVIKHADSRTLIEIAREIWRVSELARTREIQLKDLQGSTFTITNVGSLGGWFATPVINYPECAILALGRIQDMPSVVEGEVKVRKMLPVSLSFDHRIIDGALAAKFVNEIKRHLEDPNALFMGY